MRSVRVANVRSGVSLGGRILVAERWAQRLRGLLGRAGLRDGEGLLLLGCRSVHMFGMRFAIDVAFLDAEGRVRRTAHALRPWSIGRGGRGVEHALELPAGRLQETGTVPGDPLTWS